MREGVLAKELENKVGSTGRYAVERSNATVCEGIPKRELCAAVRENGNPEKWDPPHKIGTKPYPSIPTKHIPQRQTIVDVQVNE